MNHAADVGVGVAVGSACACGVLLVCVIVFVLLVLVHCAQCPDIHAAPVVNSRAPTTTWHDGDLILTQHSNYGLHKYPFVHRVLVHAGIVWIHPEMGPCVVDASGEKRADALSKTQKSGVRVSTIEDYLTEFPGFVWRRPVIRGRVDNALLSEAVTTWAAAQPFDPLVHEIKNPAWVLAIAASAFLPALAQFIETYVVPAHDSQGTRLRGVYCSELVAKLLQKTGALDPAFPAHLCYAGGFTSTHRQIDAATLNGLQWGREERLT